LKFMATVTKLAGVQPRPSKPDLATHSDLATGAVAIDRARLIKAKPSYTTRRFQPGMATTLLTGTPATGEPRPRAGDLVLAQVTRIGQHIRIELPNGRRALLYPGDEIVVAFGNRYAVDQFEAVVPDDLGPCHLVAAGGIASLCLSKHQKMKSPTEIMPIGMIADADGRPFNLADFGLAKRQPPSRRPPVTAIIGTSMNAGKTTTAAALIKGMTLCGRRVGAAKITGTGAGGDVWAMIDAGAHRVLDFTDAGYPSTNKLSAATIQDILATLVGTLCDAKVDAIVIEIADGLFLHETADLVTSERFRATVDDVVLAAGDAMGAHAGVRWLAEHGHEVALVSGVVTASALSAREAEGALDVALYDREALLAGGWLPGDRPSTGQRLGADRRLTA